MQANHKVCLSVKFSSSEEGTLTMFSRQRIFNGLRRITLPQCYQKTPRNAEKRRNDAASDKQSRLDSHLREKPQKERVVPYSDDLFRSAAIEWLVSTDQVSLSIR